MDDGELDEQQGRDIIQHRFNVQQCEKIKATVNQTTGNGSNQLSDEQLAKNAASKAAAIARKQAISADRWTPLFPEQRMQDILDGEEAIPPMQAASYTANNKSSPVAGLGGGGRAVLSRKGRRAKKSTKAQCETSNATAGLMQTLTGPG